MKLQERGNRLNCQIVAIVLVWVGCKEVQWLQLLLNDYRIFNLLIWIIIDICSPVYEFNERSIYHYSVLLCKCLIKLTIQLQLRENDDNDDYKMPTADVYYDKMKLLKWYREHPKMMGWVTGCFLVTSINAFTDEQLSIYK